MKKNNIETISAQKIKELVCTGHTFFHRKEFNFDFTENDIKEAIKSGANAYRTGSFIALVCQYRETFLDLPIIFNNNDVFDGFDHSINYVFCRNNYLTDNLTSLLVKAYDNNCRIRPHPRNAYLPSKIINSLYSSNKSGVEKVITIYQDTIISNYPGEKFNRKNTLDLLANNLDDTLFMCFIRQFYKYRVPVAVAAFTTEYIWNRAYSLIMKYKNDITKTKEYDSLKDYCSFISEGIQIAAEYRRLRFNKDYIFFKDKIYFDQLNSISNVFFNTGSKKTLDFLIEQRLINPDDCAKHFSVKDNFENFVKTASISDASISKILTSTGYNPSIKQLNSLSTYRPDIFANIAKDSLTVNIREKIEKNITGDIKKLIDAGLIHLNINVELEDCDLLNLYLQLNADK